MSEPQRYEQWAAELDDLAAVPTKVLAHWVTAQGRCLWETTSGEPPQWTGQNDPDRELATQMCTGCPVRSECLELELRLSGAQTVGVWGALNTEDRRALHQVWSSRRHADIAQPPHDEKAGQP